MTPRESDRFDKQAEDVFRQFANGTSTLIAAIADALRAAESSALERIFTKINSLIAEFGHDPVSALSIVSEYVDEALHGILRARALIPPAAAPAAETGKAQGAEARPSTGDANPHYGRDCPIGMVQVEFVGCPPSARIHEYGWKPTAHAFLEIYVDGKRFRIDVGDFHDGHDSRRGLHIVTDVGGIAFEKTAMNAASIYFAARAAPTEGEGK